MSIIDLALSRPDERGFGASGRVVVEAILVGPSVAWGQTNTDAEPDLVLAVSIDPFRKADLRRVDSHHAVPAPSS